ncbi:MAG: hypothetical protein ACI8T1_003170, partial [Verrucomicrobiales bacterium]
VFSFFSRDENRRRVIVSRGTRSTALSASEMPRSHGLEWHGTIWGSVDAILAWCIWYALRHWATPQLVYLLFCLVLIKLVIPIGVPVLPTTALPSSMVIFSDSFPAGTSFAESSEIASGELALSQAEMPSLSWTGWMLVAWVLVSFAGLARLAWIYLRTRRLLAEARLIDPETMPFSLFDLSEKVGVAKV